MRSGRQDGGQPAGVTGPTLPAVVRGWAGASHPFPLAMVLVLTTAIAFASAGGDLDASRLGLLLLAMLTSQLGIGWSNDYLDRDADAVYQPSKPVPSGVVDARLMPAAIALALAVSVAAGVLLGAVPLVLLIVGTGAGLAYNIGVKATRLSPMPYILAFAVLPPFVWTALDVYRDEFWSLYAAGVSLAFAAHLANVLPDLDTDRAQGRPTIAVALGRRGTLWLLVACMAAPFIVLAACLLWWDGLFTADDILGARPIVWVAVVYGLASLALLACYRAGRRDAEVWGFRVTVAASVWFAAGWLACL